MVLTSTNENARDGYDLIKLHKKIEPVDKVSTFGRNGELEYIRRDHIWPSVFLCFPLTWLSFETRANKMLFVGYFKAYF